MLDLFAWCIRLSRLLVGFRAHLKSMHFHLFIQVSNLCSQTSETTYAFVL